MGFANLSYNILTPLDHEISHGNNFYMALRWKEVSCGSQVNGSYKSVYQDSCLVYCGEGIIASL
jgi:hypothetical protein